MDVCRIFFLFLQIQCLYIYIPIQWTAVFYHISSRLYRTCVYFKHSHYSAQADFCQNRLFNAFLLCVSFGLLFIFVCCPFLFFMPFVPFATVYFGFIYLYCFIWLSIVVLRLYSHTALYFQCNNLNCR